MSEQRFKLDSDDENEPSEFFTDYGDFWEDGTPKTYWFDDYEDFEDIVDLLNEQQATITELAKKWRVLSQENMQLKDYIDTIFEDNTHICKYLDVEDVQFYCDKNKNYRNPSCLYKKCFDEENLIKIKDEIRGVLE